MITRPLDLQSRLSAPPRDADVFFWLNAGVVALFFGLLGARFIQGTGETMLVGGGTQGFAIPQVSSVTQAPASVVVSYRRDNMVLFEGGIFELRDLRAPLEKYAKQHPGSTLMARVDKEVSAQGLLDLCDLARQAGFAQVLLAAERRPDEGDSIQSVR
ncbi:MAG TPA: biopolymer transporter ExbD [Candidatus Didemnitutus sp.]|nr:biopolymer transporter ExbD [Candidatus Didemnitutus sp.]